MQNGVVQANGNFQELQNDPHLIEVLQIYKKQNDENKKLRDSVQINIANANTNSLLLSNSIVESQMTENDLRSSEVLVQIQNRQTIMTELTNSQILTDEDPYAPNRQSVQPKQVS